jgi:protein-S-isoprenylcysteine O-methyltransferase Ste14
MIRAIVVTVALFLFLGGCLLGAAGTLSWPLAWVVLSIYFTSKVVALVFADTEMIIERVALELGSDQVDKVLATLGYLGLYPGTFIVAGLDAVRFGPAIPIPDIISLMTVVVFAIGYGISTWAVLCNPFFSTFVRIQNDREHSVISSGPYALIRHPGYAGVLLAHLALPLALGSIWAVLPSILGIIFFVLRTSREDQELRDHLVGYREYQSRVRWRLIPGVW